MTPDKIYRAILDGITRARDARIEDFIKKYPTPTGQRMLVNADDTLLDEMARNAAQAVVLLAEDSQGGPTLAGEDISSDPLTRINQIRQVMGLDELEPRFQSTVEREAHEHEQERLVRSAIPEIGEIRALIQHLQNDRDAANTRATTAIAGWKAASDECERWIGRLRIAEAVRDDARAASARDLEERRTNAATLDELNRARRRIDELGDALTRLRAENEENKQARATSAQALHGANSKLGVALNDASIANQRRDQAWKKGVLEANDKLYAAKISGIELSWDKIFELLNILLDHPPKADDGGQRRDPDLS